MGLTREESNFLESSTTSPSTRPPTLPLKIKKSSTRTRSISLGLQASSHNISAELTGPPSPSASISDSGTNLASSLWPLKRERSYSLSPSTLLSSASSALEPSLDTDAADGRRVDLPPISPSRKSGPSDSPLPSLIPRTPRPSPPSASSTVSTSPTVLRETAGGINPFTLKAPVVNWEEFCFGPFDASLARNRQKKDQTFWAAIREAGVPIYLGTPGFDVFALCPSALGTYCSPTALLTAFGDNEVFYHVYAAGQKLSRDDLTPSKCDYDGGGVLQRAADVVLAEYGAALMEQNPGQHFTFINVKQDATSDMIARRARRLVQSFQDKGVAKDKVIVSIPATEQGVHATRILVKEDGILVNLAMVAGMSHAAVCAEVGATWITFHLDRLEKVYEDRGEPSQGIKAIQNTIALFDMHNIETKVMISGFRDVRRVLEFPGAHGFSVTKEQIVAARLPTARSCSVPPQSASSLPENAIAQAKEEKWPPRFFDTVEAGGSNGSFVRCFSSRFLTILLSTQRDLFYHTCLAIRDFLTLVRDDVVNYRIFMMQLSNPHAGNLTLAREGVKGFKRLVNLRRDLRSAEVEWKRTITGRVLPDVEWRPAKVDKCEVWITADGRIEAQIPQRWDRRKAASANVYSDLR